MSVTKLPGYQELSREIGQTADSYLLFAMLIPKTVQGNRY